jgi:hypothetical protein
MELAQAKPPAADRRDPLITVITPVLNGVKHLEQCILSVARQTYPRVEFIVIDGGSTDGSRDLIRQYDAVIDHWASEPDSGIYEALNKGIQASTGDWICVLGSDDFLYADNVLERVATYLSMCDPVVKLVYGSVAMLEGERELDVVERPWLEAKPRMSESTAVPYTGLMHRKSWFDQYGLYDTTFRIAGDYELLLRGWPHEDAWHVPGLRTCAVRVGGISNRSGFAFDSVQEVNRAREMHGIKASRRTRGRVFGHTLIRFVLQSTFGDGAMWRLRRLRHMFDAAAS